MKKLDLAVRIASALFNKTVQEDHPKVKDLMKRTKSELEDHCKIADRIIDKKEGENNGKRT